MTMKIPAPSLQRVTEEHKKLNASLVPGAYIPPPSEFTESDQAQMDALIEKKKAHEIKVVLQSCAYFSRDYDTDTLTIEEIEDCLEVTADPEGPMYLVDGEYNVYGYTRRNYEVRGVSLLVHLAGTLLEGYLDPEDDTEGQLSGMPDSVTSAANSLAKALSTDWKPWACDQTRVFTVMVENGRIDEIEVVR